MDAYAALPAWRVKRKMLQGAQLEMLQNLSNTDGQRQLRLEYQQPKLA